MHKTIDFPNIGIHLSGVGDHITIFNFDIAYYGMIIGLGILAGIFVAAAEAKRTRQNPENYYDLAIYAVICAIIGARAYYVAFSWDMYKGDLKSILNLRQGGLAIYGGVIAAVITVIVFARVKKLSAPLLFDTAVLGLVTGQMIGRWGNFFNREAFGGYTNGLLAMRLPLDAVRESDVTEPMRQHMEVVKGVSYIQVHPTFLYESLWCMALLLALLLYRSHKKFDGEVFLLYLLGYGLGRVWIEGLRTDQLLIPGTAVPVSQLLAGSMVIVSTGIILWIRRKIKKS
ncbi:MAG: prolipoprotein diacylglyceryl transferase [Dorea sp.]|jgi:phosphatidylglycerol:prolipoprotein diacylglycerol transferase|nr:prolipoprotein diacylglyceryl transferase [Dorea sp.]